MTLLNVNPPVLYPAWFCLYLAKHDFTKRDSACIVPNVILLYLAKHDFTKRDSACIVPYVIVSVPG